MKEKAVEAGRVWDNSLQATIEKTKICAQLPTAMCHGSCIIALPQGRLLAAWFGGSREGEADVAIYASEYCPGNGGWTEPEQLTDEAEACWNPSFLLVKNRVLLFYKVGNKIATWRTMVKEAALPLAEEKTEQLEGDNGKAPLKLLALRWSRGSELVPGDGSGGRGPVRTKAIVLHSGRICAGGSLEQGAWTAFCDYSDDRGATWQRSQELGLSLQVEPEKRTATADCTIPLSEQSFYGRGIIQPSLWQDAQGLVHMYLRSTEGYLYYSLSRDEGVSWSSPRATQLPNNNSGFDLLALGRTPRTLYLVCNPVGGNWGSRTPLTLFKSVDNGAGWTRLLDLEDQPGEYSYPSLTCNEEGLWCSYTYNRTNIAVAKIPVEV